LGTVKPSGILKLFLYSFSQRSSAFSEPSPNLQSTLSEMLEAGELPAEIEPPPPTDSIPTHRDDEPTAYQTEMYLQQFDNPLPPDGEPQPFPLDPQLSDMFVTDASSSFPLNPTYPAFPAQQNIPGNGGPSTRWVGEDSANMVMQRILSARVESGMLDGSVADPRHVVHHHVFHHHYHHHHYHHHD
jgi:hypothetical protein